MRSRDSSPVPVPARPAAGWPTPAELVRGLTFGLPLSAMLWSALLLLVAVVL